MHFYGKLTLDKRDTIVIILLLMLISITMKILENDFKKSEFP